MSEEEVKAETTLLDNADDDLVAEGQSLENWQDYLKEDYKDNPAIKKFSDLNGMAKSYIELEKSLGNRIKKPTDESSENDWKEFYTKMGRPENSKDYSYEKGDMPKDINWDESIADRFRPIAHKMGMNQKQFGQLMKYIEAETVDNHDRLIQKESTNYNEAVNAIKEKFGGGYKNVLTQSGKVLSMFANEETITKIRKTLGNDIGFIEFLNNIQKNMVSDQIEQSGHSGTKTIEDQISSFWKGSDEETLKAYLDEKHPKNKQAKEKLASLYEQRYAE